MTVRLRPHHLLCMLTYVGKGYSAAFVAHYDEIARRLSDGEDIVIVEGPDDICAPLLNEDDPHCWRDSVGGRDAAAAAQVGALLGITIAAGTRLDLRSGMVRRMRTAFAEGATRSACAGCEWSELCSGIAAGGYGAVRIHAPAPERSSSPDGPETP